METHVAVAVVVADVAVDSPAFDTAVVPARWGWDASQSVASDGSWPWIAFAALTNGEEGEGEGEGEAADAREDGRGPMKTRRDARPLGYRRNCPMRPRNLPHLSRERPQNISLIISSHH